MANVLFTRTDDPNSKPITDGQLIFDTSGTGKMYLDNGAKRLEMGGGINVDSVLDATSKNPIQNKAVAGVMLNTLKEINAVTTKGKLTDALATKELNTKVTGLETDVSSLTDDYVSKGKILKSLEEVTATTNAGFVPDALAIKELDTDLQGQIDTLNSNLAEMFVVERYKATSTINCPANSFTEKMTISVAKEGYTPILATPVSSGRSQCSISFCYLQTDNTVEVRCINVTSSAYNVQPTIDVLYRKS